jgi:osmoprotectant transport system substrate-binding protein
MNRKVSILVVLLVGMVLAAGCITGDDGEKRVVIGSKLFNEQYIVAHMAALLLEEQGYDVEVKEGLGGTSVNYEALKKGQIDCYLEYTGTAYNVIFKAEAPEVWDVDDIYAYVENAFTVEDDITIAADIGFRDDYAIAVHLDWAQQMGVTRISELSAYIDGMEIGTDPEFASRADGLPQMLKVYGFTFGKVNQMQPTLMYEAMKNDQVDAISAYTTDARVDMYGLLLLEDDLMAFPPYNAILIVNDEIAQDADAMAALAQLAGLVDTDTMRALNYEYDVEKREAEDIARDFLVSVGLL